MSLQVIDLDTPQQGGALGEPPRSCFIKINEMFAELYGLAVGARVGNYAQRPAAATALGRLYYSLDTQELYTPIGTSWVLLPSGGAELAYAQRTTASQYTTNVYADVSGVSVTYIAGERAVEARVRFTCKVTSGTAVVAIFIDDAMYQQILISSTGYQTFFSSHRLPQKPPGTSVNVKLRAMHSTPGQTFDLFGADVDPVSLSVVNR
ncbi:hypothetical protein ACDJ03_19960 [Xanthomonas axonopodis pv. nakataecorchori]|uniref:hypothetical protein n=1 Tax=Xanthomonas axonopodis TaxID=53413 RepID=UPI0035314B32